LGPHLTQNRLGWGLLPCQVPSWCTQPYGHNKCGMKILESPPPFGGNGSPSNAYCSHLIRGVPPYQVAYWSMQPFGCNRYGPKIGGLALLGEGELSPHLTHCGQGRGLPACQVSSWSVQPFGHSTPTLQTGHERTYRTGQRSNSIGRTVLQTVAQKFYTVL